MKASEKKASMQRATVELVESIREEIDSFPRVKFIYNYHSEHSRRKQKNMRTENLNSKYAEDTIRIKLMQMCTRRGMAIGVSKLASRFLPAK